MGMFKNKSEPTDMKIGEQSISDPIIRRAVSCDEIFFPLFSINSIISLISHI